jgi:hypothetical protein
LSGGDRCWFRRSAREKRSMTRENERIVIIIIIIITCELVSVEKLSI